MVGRDVHLVLLRHGRPCTDLGKSTLDCRRLYTRCSTLLVLLPWPSGLRGREVIPRRRCCCARRRLCGAVVLCGLAVGRRVLLSLRAHLASTAVNSHIWRTVPVLARSRVVCQRASTVDGLMACVAWTLARPRTAVHISRNVQRVVGGRGERQLWGC